MRKIKKAMGALLVPAMLICSVQSVYGAQEGFQEGTDETKEINESQLTGSRSEIGMLGYVGNVTQGDREIDIDKDGITDYIVPANDFISVNVTMESFAVATMKADDTPDFRCGTIAIINENENRPVKVQIQEVNMEEAPGIKLVSWDRINSSNPETGKEIALKVKSVRKDDFPETDAGSIGKTGEASYLTITDSLKGAIGYTLDGNYTEQLLNENQETSLPKISFVYKVTPGPVK